MAIDVRRPALMVSWQDDDDVLSLEPLQGHWTDDQYLLLTNQTNWLIELSDGVMELLPIPTDRHQVIVRALFLALFAFLQPRGGTVHFAPLRLRVGPGRYREPDLLLRDANDPRRRNAAWTGADLVVEVISSNDRERDTVAKRAIYAAAAIPEYWLVDPDSETVTVLTLVNGVYAEHGAFGRGHSAASARLAGFSVEVNVVFDEA